MNDCTLIFINFNTPDLALQAIASAKQSTKFADKLKFIVVDNGSSDDSTGQIKQACPEATVIEMGRNSGFAAAANAGLAAAAATADAKFAFICNTDIIFHKSAIDTLVQTLAADETVALACPQLLRDDGSPQAAAVPEPAIFWELLNRSLPRRFLKLHDNMPTAVPTVVGPCMALNMKHIRTLDGFDEHFFFFFEETDLCRRINRANYKCMFVPAAQITHFQGKTANLRPIRARIQFFESRYKYFRKHTGRTGVAILFAGLLTKLMLNTFIYAVFAVFNKKFRDKLAVSSHILLWHLRGCPPGYGFAPSPQ